MSARVHETAARPLPTGFHATLTSRRQLRTFNEAGGIPVNFDTLRITTPQIEIAGRQSAALSVWATRSASGFLTHPKFNTELLSLRFVTSGRIIYRRKAGEDGAGAYMGLPDVATLVAFDELRQVEASADFDAVAATLTVAGLAAAQAALDGGPAIVPPFEPTARIDAGLRALYCTIREVERRIVNVDHPQDHMLPLLHEIMCYQLLSAWPKRSVVAEATPHRLPPRYLRCALDYIEANLARPMRLAEIAAVAGVSVRAIQLAFKDALGQSPTQYIIAERLTRAHRDLTDRRQAATPISELARRWGFVHMNDFGQRHRRLYGCSPREARRQAVGSLRGSEA